MVKPPHYVSAIQPYVPGKPVEELERELGIRDSVKLASNENPLGPSPLVLKEIVNDLTNTKSSLSLNRYPDGNGYYLKQALSRRLSVSEDEIILGNGSNELIDIAARTFLQPGDEAVMAHPSFVVYPMATQAQGATAIQIPLKKYTHDLDAMADAITSSTKIVFIANPNNPTGTMNTKAEFERVVKRIPEGILVVCDEAYCEYVTKPDYPDSMKYLAQGKDILILRTFSKMYGLAGLRIGYGIGRKDIIGEMNKLRPPFNTSSIAQKAALWALQDENHLRRTREINEQGKTYLYKELDSIGMKYVPTEANFIFMPLEHDAHTLYTILLKQGVIVRPMGQHEIRVTIGLPEENKRFIDALKKGMG
ncbi:MAG TPA: histidinol-phosphate transaminase [Thermodesulfovibrionales bacterium]|jgi:histidinol-phosphate aminotransferase|nr:histidinol-phosphate transaminase [Thermodesulfovibrionales bacterium]